MDQLLLLFLFCLPIFLFYIRRFLQPSQTTKLPPGPTGLPIIGSLLELGSQPHESLSKLAKIHGPLMALRLGSITTVVASSPEMAKQILHKHDQSFSNRTIPDVINAMPNREGTLAWIPGDQRWRNLRRICNTQMFSNHRLDSLQHLRCEKVQQLVAHIKRRCVSGDPVDIGRLVFATSLNLISNTILSIDIVDQKFESAQEFKDLVWRIMEDAGKPNISDYFPMLRRFDLQGVRRHIQPAYRRLHEIIDDIVDKRMESRALDKTSRKGDFLDVLLDQCEEDGSNFNHQKIKSLILELFYAGGDTSSITTEWAMTELLRNPNALQKARKELVETIGTEQSVKESDIHRLPYLQAVVKETMRLHPAGPLLLPFKAQNDVEVCGFTIPKDSQVLVNAWAIARDPKYWEDPLLFSPERFLGSKIDFRGQDFEFIPFGAGRRICPGMALAVRMISLMLASIIHPFNWKLPKGTNPENIDMTEQFGVTLKKTVPLLAIPLGKLHGPLMTLRLGSVTTIVASSPETAKEILHKHDQTFSGRSVPDAVSAQPNPEGTLAWTPGDQRWRNRRRICNTQMFNNQRLDSLQHLRHEKVGQLIAHIRKHCELGRPVDIGQLAFATSLNLVSNTIFSIDLVDQDFNSAQEFKDLVWRIMEDAGKPNLSDYFPILRPFDLQGVRRHILSSYRRMHEIFDDIIGTRLKARASDKMSRTGDFLDVLLDQCEEEGSDFNLQNIKPLILVRELMNINKLYSLHDHDFIVCIN
ncbi:hypothetical protein L1049_021626 [Liquidambar formosana]|uniref:Cytochrome P450 n=1 Tax=Liquidambar formosana TaxID=63359 RepID=A0AAP0N6D9_LIQFO